MISFFSFLLFFSKRNWKKDSFQNLAQISRKRIQLTNLILVPVTYRCAPPTPPPTHTPDIYWPLQDPEFIAVKFPVPEKPGYSIFHQIDHVYFDWSTVSTTTCICWCIRFYIMYLVYTNRNIKYSYISVLRVCISLYIYFIFQTRNSTSYWNENCLNR